MRVRALVVTGLVVVAVGTYVLLDADPEGRAELWNRVTTAFGAEQEPEAVPNWGDVAERIGQFTDEERALREVLTPAAPPETPPAEAPAPTETPAAEPAAPAAGLPAPEAAAPKS
ncbi:MAG: hypothetical protein IT534_01160 [Bauldia sp.]|nr:hypothetical protein [Bauldia sp.]